MKRTLIVVDMQNDFIDMALGTAEAVAIVPKVKAKIREYVERGDEIIFTRDTHFENYLSTQEGKKLPVVHCIEGTKGWEICAELKPFVKTVVDKITFGSVDLPHLIKDFGDEIEEIELCGLCTDICVISNAIVLKTAFPEVRIVVDGKCSAGVTMQSHETALSAMKAVQIEVV